MRTNQNVTEAPIGVRLRALRKAKGLSMKELAARAGSSPSAIHRYESGWDRFEVRTLRRIAEALGVRLFVTLEEAHEDPTTPVAEAADLVALWKNLFWDVDLDVTHLHANADWVLRRVLTVGDVGQVRAARARFGDNAIVDALSHRDTDPRVRAFWKVVLRQPGSQP